MNINSIGRIHAVAILTLGMVALSFAVNSLHLRTIHPEVRFFKHLRGEHANNPTLEIAKCGCEE